MAPSTWIKAAIAVLGAIGGSVAMRSSREKTADDSIDFSQRIWTGFIHKLESEIQRKDRDIHQYRMEIARLGVAVDKAHERINNSQFNGQKIRERIK